MRIFLIIALVGLLCSTALADQISLKNGDRLTGTIVKLEGDKLTMKTDLAGEVNVQWDAIAQITSNEPLYLTAKDGRVIVGTVTTTDGRIEVQTDTNGRVAVAKESVQLIRSQDAQAAYEAELARQRRAAWSGSADAGLSLTRGNADTLTVALGTQEARTTQKDKLSFYTAALFARNSTSGVSITTAEAIRGGVRYDRNINARLFAFVLTDVERDKFQLLDLRLVPGGGLGYHARKTDRMKLDLFAGGTFDRERFSTGLRRSSAEALFGEEVSYKLSNTTSLEQRAAVFPNLTNFGEYRLTFDLTGVTKLTKQLGIQVTLSDRFQSNPLPGIKKNDLLLTTGLRLTFGSAEKK